MKGIYCLLIHLDRTKDIQIGARGLYRFQKGNYLYVGSAQNNLEKRIQRHKSNNKNFKWHIDYLLAQGKIKRIYCQEGQKNQECLTAQWLLQYAEPVKGFGASDCKCPAHLFRIRRMPDLKARGFTLFEHLQ